MPANTTGSKKVFVPATPGARSGVNFVRNASSGSWGSNAGAVNAKDYQTQLAAGVPRDQLYNTTMYILCAMLIAGLICNYLIKPVDHKWHMSADEVAKLQAAASAKSEAAVQHGSFGIGKGGLDARAALFWAFVGIPLAWGVWKTLESAIKIF